MQIYYFLLILILLTALFDAFLKKKGLKIKLCTFIAILLFLVMAMREESIGTDLEKYISIFKSTKNSNILDYLIGRISFPSYEPGWILYNYIISYIGGERLFLVITSAIYIFSIYYFIYHYSPLPFLSFGLFILCNFYFSEMNLLRQYMAISILLFSLKYILNRSFGKFVFILFLASIFHRIALFYLILYFIYPIKITRKYLLFIFLVTLLIYLFLGQFIFSHILSIFNLTKFEKYILVGSNGGTILFLFLLSFTLLGLLLSNSKRNNPIFRLFFQMMLLSIIIQSFALTIAELARLTFFFYIGFLIYLPYILSYVKMPLIRFFLISFTICIMLAYFIITSFGNMDNVIPYKFMQL